MDFTLEKLEKRTRELEAFRYVNLQDISPMQLMEAPEVEDGIHRQPPQTVQGRELCTGDFLSGWDQYWWCQKVLELPTRRRGLTPVGIFDFGNTGHGNNDGFEGLLYLDSHPYQGIDANHRDVVFSPEWAGKTVNLQLLLWSGLQGGGAPKTQYHQARRMQVGYLHEDTDALYYFFKAIYKTLKLLPESDGNYYALLDAADRALAILNWDEDRFYDTVGGALDCLNHDLDRMEKNSKVTVWGVGHTHIDVAWLWRLRHTREKAMRSFSTVLRLMEEFDEYVFLQSQPQLYQFIKEDSPELYGKIKQRVSDSRWEADGAMWLEADCNVTSGESLVRQLLEGITFFQEEFGVRCHTLWLPDVFGYSWALPQLLRQCGIDTFMTTKISWNKYNTMPNDLFRWKGIDGTEILTYFINTPEIGQPSTSRFATYNGMLSPRSVLGSWEKFKNKDITQNTLISYGFGDGGGGPNRNMLKMRRAMARLPGLPNVKAASSGEFFKKIHADADKAGEKVPVWDGELYLEFHRGTYTSQARNKQKNRRLEFSLCQAEWISALSYVLWNTYEESSLEEAWKIVLRNQFHDIIPGSSIHEVYADSQKEYQRAQELLHSACQAGLEKIETPSNDSYTLYNFSSFARADLAWVPEEREGRFVGQSGEELTAVRGWEGYRVRVPMQPLSCRTIRFIPGEVSEKPSGMVVDVEERVVTTPFYRLKWNPDGSIGELYDRRCARQLLAGDSSANRLMVYEDKPLEYDAWELEPFYPQKGEALSAQANPEVLECSALRVVVRFDYRYHHSQIIQDMTLYANSPRIDFATRVDWHESNRLLKVLFPVNIRSTKASYEIQYGYVERPNHRNTSWDEAKFEVVGHRWADLSQTDYGVSLLNDSKYGYGVQGNVMSLSLLKSAKFPDTSADMGEHYFAYSIMGHEGGVAQGDTIEEAAALNLPILVSKGESVLEERSILRVDNRSVTVDAVKKAKRGDAVVVRLHECRGGCAKGELRSDLDLVRFAPSNPLEEAIGPITEGSVIPFELGPFEVQTYLLWFR